MTPIKLLHLVNSMNLGGGARAVRTFYKYLPYAVEMHVISIFEKGEKYDEFAATCPRLNFAEGSSDYILNYVKEHEITVVHFHGRGKFSSFDQNLVKQLKPTCKIVYTNIFGEFHAETNRQVDQMIFKSMHAFTQKFAPAARIHLSDEASWVHRYHVMPNPVDVEYFDSIRPDDDDILGFRQRYGLVNKPVIGKVGSRKAIEKWSDLLLFMLPEVLAVHPDAVMVLQGVPDSRQDWVRSFGDRIKQVPITNDDAELAIMYHALDVFTHASKIGEHSGNSINEAMFWGKPVVVNLTPNKDNGQFEQLVHGQLGYFANTSHQYAEYVNQLLSDSQKRIEMGTRAAAFVRDHNDARRLSTELGQLYVHLFETEPNDEPIGFTPEQIIAYAHEYQNYMSKYEQSSLLSPLYKNNRENIFFKLYLKLHDYYDVRFAK